MKGTKCLTPKCNRLGQFKNGYCFWCNRRTQFINNVRLGYDSRSYNSKTDHDKHNQVPCIYPNCKDTRNAGSTSNYCIKHRIKTNRLENANLGTN